MIDRDYFYKKMAQCSDLPRNGVSAGQRKGVEALFNYWEEDKTLKDIRWLAYILATAFHETKFKIMPIEEDGKGVNKPYGKKLKYRTYDDKKRKGEHIPYTEPDKIYYGRGFAQVTWYENYENFNNYVKGHDFLNYPERMLDLDIAAKVTIIGMVKGAFTGVGLKKFFPETEQFPANAPSATYSDNSAELAQFPYLKGIEPFWNVVPNNTGLEKNNISIMDVSPVYNKPHGDWYNARRIINGVDRALDIEKYALAFYVCLNPQLKSTGPFWTAPPSMLLPKYDS